MKIALSFLCLASCSALWAQPANVDSKQCSGASGCTTAAMNNTGATFLAVYVNCLSNAGGTDCDSMSISSSPSTTWTSCTAQKGPTGGSSGWIAVTNMFYAVNPTVSGSQTVTLAMGGSITSTVFASSFNGTATTSPLDGSCVSAASGTTTGLSVQPGSITPSANGELLLTGSGTYCGSGCNGTTVPPSVNSSYTVLQGMGSNANADGGIAWQVQATAAAINPTWSLTSGVTNGWCSHQLAIKLPGGASGPPSQPTVIGIL